MVVSKLLGLPANFGKTEKLSGELFIRFQQLFAWINHFAANHTHTGGADGASVSAGGDGDAIHDNVASEISAITAKVSPTTADFIIIEDAADSNNKKSITISDLPGAGAGASLKTGAGPDASDYWEIVEIDGGDSLIIHQRDDSAGAFLERFEIVGKGTGLTNPGDIRIFDLDGAAILEWDESTDHWEFRKNIAMNGAAIVGHSILQNSSGPDSGDAWRIDVNNSGDSWVLRQFDSGAASNLDRFEVIGTGGSVTNDSDMFFYKADGTTVSLQWDESDGQWEFAAIPSGINHALFSTIHTDVNESDTPGDNELLQFDSGSGKWNAEAASAHGSHGTGDTNDNVDFAEIGTLTTKTGTLRWYPPFNITISDVTASVGTQPTDASILVDVNKNGTTIFTTQSNRPTIASASNFDKSGAPDTTALTGDTDYITVDIDQVGSTNPGADMIIQIRYTKA